MERPEENSPCTQEIIELLRKLLAESHPRKLLELLKHLRQRLAEERVRLQKLTDKNAAMRKSLDLDS